MKLYIKYMVSLRCKMLASYYKQLKQKRKGKAEKL